MSDSKIPSNVIAFVKKASDDISKIEAEHFFHEMHANIIERPIESPIEQMFWVALHVMCRANYEEVNPEPVLNPRKELVLGFGVYLLPQFSIGKYKVDFLARRTNIYGDVVNEVIVELDGHDFHDKDKHQRSYEKARDRHLLKAGFKVLHFTGSDVHADPYKVAHEVMDVLECFGPVGASPYDSTDPFAVGF